MAVPRGMGILLRLLVAAGLAVDAWIHWRFAPDMAPGKNAPSGTIAGDDLFRAQAIAAVVAAVLVLAWASKWTYAIAFVVAASAAGAVLAYYWWDFGRIGPIPRMYDPSWYSDKTISLAGEVVAALAALAGFFTVGDRERRRSTAPTR
ncbi:hypothetical protein [Actinomadura fibrosa]|uniref:Uncharacterized protein n=1 Tax=Actinomadura fibrosa TaxID=111802 RepID=A0ABW2XNM1_9ACTN|nr:hypothetical protein [Actinomadura fibrosa]